MIDVYIRRLHIRVLKHITKSPTQDTGSYEVTVPDAAVLASFFYWDDNPDRRSIINAMSNEEAMGKARDLALSKTNWMEDVEKKPARG